MLSIPEQVQRAAAAANTLGFKTRTELKAALDDPKLMRRQYVAKMREIGGAEGDTATFIQVREAYELLKSLVPPEPENGRVDLVKAIVTDALGRRGMENLAILRGLEVRPGESDSDLKTRLLGSLLGTDFMTRGR